MDSQNMPTDQNLDIPADVRGFLENLILDAGLTPLDETAREQMIQELYIRLDNFLTSEIIKSLPPEQLEEFVQLNEREASQEEINQFMTEKIPNAQDLFGAALVNFRDLYLGESGVGNPSPVQ